MNRYGLFSLGSLNYAVPLPLIRKIVQDANSHQLPRLPETIMAVMVEDSEIIPVIALNAWFCGAVCSSSVASEYRVLVDTACGLVALPAEINGRIVSEHKGTLLRQKKVQTPFVDAEFRFQQTVYKILDMNFPAEEMRQVSSRTNPDSVA